MSQIETDRGLNAAQTAAVTALLAGHTVVDAAKRANVSRATVHRWLAGDHRVQAALNEAKQALWACALTSLLGAAEQASRLVAARVAEGDVKVGVQLLQGIGLLSGRPIDLGSSSEPELRRLTKLRRNEQLARLNRLGLRDL